ncbi:alpha-amylase family glycosyl hydrolase [Plebeiibacterium sediminum]|uniref:Alpha-amylase family glycosyl hydrolase n=1 Tax=Plebeiibacterium sediminum TaxID=2992112 RepID=A0AAE3M7S5_9BACT|nr:alpha-amylase family glycosyl hydrolase [Plebeiobacterium sediminum]MCW3788556.1 alpha-amylase family glycosyl hydrolase [Plebeiobacterium sediminum]
MNRILIFIGIFVALMFVGCQQKTEKESKEDKSKKVVVYQVFTRLFGNTNTTNKPWGTIEENGVGKFNDFTDKALSEIKDLGVTHVWYTGVPHHATITDYTKYGISNDDPDVVKGRAGSPYAVKDYYQVDPDLAEDPANRLEEFKALVIRTHQHGMKVIIDIVPNHVARNYHGLNNPEGVTDFGADDDTTVEYAKDNNFYYVVNEPFKVPEPLNGYKPLGGEKHPMADGKFEEDPAKWTGNGSRLSQPSHYDWYETVKINYGVKPDGTLDFDTLPSAYSKMDYKAHFEFWKNKEVPNSWKKFRDIALFWIDFGVDGFRYDMAEMVPVEFWSFMNSSVKMKNPDAFLLAEVYQPKLFRDYIHKGKMDYLYDKVDLYDTLKHVMQGYGSTNHIAPIQKAAEDIEHHMLHFLENHDEQRIASPEFAGDAFKGMPAMVVSATLSTSPTMIYFGQEVGEPGAEEAGFGAPSRTSIFDYIGVPHHQRWMNNGAFDGGQLSDKEKELRDFYKRLLNFTINSNALMGEYAEIHDYNRKKTEGYNDKVYAFVRWSKEEKLIVVSNFGQDKVQFNLRVPASLLVKIGIVESIVTIEDLLYHQFKTSVKIDHDMEIPIQLESNVSYILKVN